MSRNSRHTIYQHKRSLTCGNAFIVVRHLLVVALCFAGFPRDRIRFVDPDDWALRPTVGALPGRNPCTGFGDPVHPTQFDTSVFAEPCLQVSPVDYPEDQQDTLGVEQVVHDQVIAHPEPVQGVRRPSDGLDALATTLAAPHTVGNIEQGIPDPLTEGPLQVFENSLRRG